MSALHTAPVTAAADGANGVFLLFFVSSRVVEYRLAPEHDVSEGIADCITAYRWLLQTTPASSIIIAGDSAGGGTATLVMQRLRRHGLPQPVCGILMSPWLDLSMDMPSRQTEEDVLFFQPALFTEIIRYVVPHDRDPRDTCYSALYGDWAGLPPLYIIIGATERLADDSVVAAQKVREAGGRVELDISDYGCHIFPTFCLVVPEAMEALGRLATFVRDSLHAATLTSSSSPYGRRQAEKKMALELQRQLSMEQSIDICG